MRDAKIVAYGSISKDDERLITNYLEEKDLEVKILSVDSSRNKIQDLELAYEMQASIIETRDERILELEEQMRDLEPEPEEPEPDDR